MTDYQVRELIKAVKEVSLELRNLRRELMKHGDKTVENKNHCSEIMEK